VHSLNGVAERAIRSIMEHVRSDLVASNAPIGFWTHAAEHAVDILNRTTGPPGSNVTAYESLTGAKPTIMSILPFGCRTFSVKPRSAYLKTEIQSRSWPGIHVGRCPNIPGAYRTWMPQLGKIVSSSEVYFNEDIYPWRPDTPHATLVPTAPPDADHTQMPGLPAAGFPAGIAPTPDAPAPQSIAQAFASAVRPALGAARDSRRVLLLFSGPYRRPDGLAAFLRQRGLDVVLFDNDPKHGGEKDDITKDDV